MIPDLWISREESVRGLTAVQW